MPTSLSQSRTASPTLRVDHPVFFDWLASVARVAGRSKALHAATALVWLAARRRSPCVSLSRRTMANGSLSRDAAGDALRLLRAHRLLLAWSAPGRSRRVILTEPGSDRPLRLD